MPPANQLAVSSLSFADVLDAVNDRLTAASGVPEHRIRWVVVPDDQLPEVLGDPGLTIRVFPPDPDLMSGSGRHGMLVQRRLEVFVTTENLRDPGGRANKALRAHILVEEAVINCLTLDPPTGHGASIYVSKLIKWVPGGSQIARRLKKNPALLVSSLGPFVIAPHLIKNVPYDAAKDFDLLTVLVQAPNVLVVPAAAPRRRVFRSLSLVTPAPGPSA